ncbi:MAG: PRC-barrel domain-containing protein, partial [Clostridia bacterium]
MRKISEFLSKPLISLSNASYEGTIIGVLCENKLKAIEFLVVLIESDTLDEKKYVALKNIKNTTIDSVTIVNNLCIKKADELDLMRYTENPINSSVYDTDGELIGKLTDLFFADTTKNIVEIEVNGQATIPSTKIASTSHDIIIVYSANHSSTVRRATPRKIKKPASDTIVELCSDKNSIEIFCASDAISENFDQLDTSLSPNSQSITLECDLKQNAETSFELAENTSAPICTATTLSDKFISNLSDKSVLNLPT